jgi:Large eukaryotic DNA virus major capsid protein/Major capsid protein N-terminus
MPGGALMQLVAFGAQDAYLTGQPKVTFFHSVYKRHTNFAMESSQQTVQGGGSLQSVILARSGDLVGDMYVVLNPIPNNNSNLTSTNSVNDMCWVAERAFSTVELFIGGQSIDKHYQLWFRLYSEVFMNETKKVNYGKLTSLPIPNNVGQTSTGYVYLPLLFFFNRNPGMYLPLIALQYHEVRIDFTLTNYYSSYFGINPIAVWANYIYLDTAERDRYAKGPQEYLIEQVQHVAGDPVPGTNENAPTLVRLQYNHPVKELIWCYQDPTPLVNKNSLWNFSSGVSNVNVTVDTQILGQTTTLTNPNWIGTPLVYTPGIMMAPLFVTSNTQVVASNIVPSNINFQSNVSTTNINNFWLEAGLPIRTSNTTYGVEVGPLHQFKLLLNGTDRFVPQFGKYFNQYQPYQYHTGSPYPGIYVYSFGLKPEDIQPSGTCNFSRIDMAQAAVYLKSGMPGNLLQKMFAVNYNVLKIASGMGGLVFSN